jgi:hypothetical protein
MTLARIITHSDLCARELAFHLLGRGYAVEIVSPDSIPNNFADLELRVDAHSGDQLVASLTAHEAQRTASLDFVHRVKVPIEEVMLTPPEVAPRFLDNPVVINVAQDVGDIEAGSAYAASQSVYLQETTLPDIEFRTNLPREEAAPPPPPEDQLPFSASATAELENAPVEAMPYEAMPCETKPAAARERETPGKPLSYFTRQTSSIALPFAGPAVVLPTSKPKPQLVERSNERKSVVPAALTLAAVVLLAVFLASGVRQTAKASDGSLTPPTTAAMPDRETAPSVMSEKVATVDRPSPNRPVAGRPKISTRHTPDLIAPNTVIYLDSRYKPLSKPKASQKTKQTLKQP